MSFLFLFDIKLVKEFRTSQRDRELGLLTLHCPSRPGLFEGCLLDLNRFIAGSVAHMQLYSTRSEFIWSGGCWSRFHARTFVSNPFFPLGYRVLVHRIHSNWHDLVLTSASTRTNKGNKGGHRLCSVGTHKRQNPTMNRFQYMISQNNWMLPEIVVPLNHPCVDGRFPMETP